MKIVTGKRGTPHVSSNDDQGRNQAVFGTGCYVFDIGTKFELTLVSANEAQIGDGEGVMYGVHFRIEPHTYDTVTIDNGSQGMKRIDLIVARYEKNATTGVENVTLQVIKGSSVSVNPQAPSYNTGDVLQGDLIVDMPLYEVLIDGVTVSSTTSKFNVLHGYGEWEEKVEDLQDQITALNTVESTTMSFLNATATLYKIGKIVLFQYSGNATRRIGSNEEVNAGTLPIGYRPIVTCANFLFTSRVSGGRVKITFNTDGSVIIQNYEQSAVLINDWISSFYTFITS